MAISLLINTAGGSNLEAYHLRNLGSLHVGGSALATETLDVTGTVGQTSPILCCSLISAYDNGSGRRTRCLG